MARFRNGVARVLAPGDRCASVAVFRHHHVFLTRDSSRNSSKRERERLSETARGVEADGAPVAFSLLSASPASCGVGVHGVRLTGRKTAPVRWCHSNDSNDDELVADSRYPSQKVAALRDQGAGHRRAGRRQIRSSPFTRSPSVVKVVFVNLPQLAAALAAPSTSTVLSARCQSSRCH